MDKFLRYQIPGEVRLSVMSPQAGTQDTVLITDCERDICPAIQAIVGVAFRKLGADLSPDPQANLALAIESFTPFGVQNVLLLGKAPKTTTFNSVSIPAVGFEFMRARYGTVDDHDPVVNEIIQTPISVANTGQTTITGATLNADFRTTGFPTGLGMRQFAVLLELTVPDDIYYLTFGATGAASPVPETMRVEFEDTECRTIRLLLIQCNRTRNVVNFGTPTTGGAVVYQLPYQYADVEAPGGSPIFLTVSGYDSAGAQVAFTLPATTWNLPYSGQLTDALMAHKGISSPGARAAYIAGTLTFPIPNTQPTY